MSRERGRVCAATNSNTWLWKMKRFMAFFQLEIHPRRMLMNAILEWPRAKEKEKKNQIYDTQKFMHILKLSTENEIVLAAVAQNHSNKMNCFASHFFRRRFVSFGNSMPLSHAQFCIISTLRTRSLCIKWKQWTIGMKADCWEIVVSGDHALVSLKRFCCLKKWLVNF